MSFEFNEDSRIKYLLPIALLKTMFPIALALNYSLYGSIHISFSLNLLTYTLLLVIPYVYIYRKFKSTDLGASRIYLYTMGISFLIYSIAASYVIDQELYPIGMRFVLIGFGSIVVYTILTLLNDDKLKYLFYIFIHVII